MNIGEVGFVILKDDGSYLNQPGGRRSRRRGKPFATWAAADKYNRQETWVYVSGQGRTRSEKAPIGKIVMVRLVPVVEAA